MGLGPVRHGSARATVTGIGPGYWHRAHKTVGAMATVSTTHFCRSAGAPLDIVDAFVNRVSSVRAIGTRLEELQIMIRYALATVMKTAVSAIALVYPHRCSDHCHTTVHRGHIETQNFPMDGPHTLYVRMMALGSAQI